ncbi:MAG: hypothetical protein O3A37_05220 [Planctomycetota bacterium]|jgi:hypothetical protein|nr:hypothetical protein [Planctomycetota bacterium]
MPTAALPQLVAILETSPVMYVADSGIWSYPGDEDLKLALADIVGDQRNVAERAAAVLAEREVAPPQTGYPLSYTAWHDLDLVYLLPRLIEGMRRQVAAIDVLVAARPDDATAMELAAEAKATTLGHIDVLEQQASRLRHASSPA